jgi:hypothetical protein
VPSIVATPYPTRGQVLVEVAANDVVGATYVCINAVDVTSGATRKLHPYVSYNSDGCLALSCGQAIFWDTEIGCGKSTQYCATFLNAAGETITTAADPLLLDTFTRTVAASWGTSDSGNVYTSTGGAAADHSVTGTRGQHAVTSTFVLRVDSTPIATPNYIAQVTAFPAAVALTQSTEQWMVARANSAGTNGYKARLRYNTTGLVDLILESITGGVPTSLGLVSNFVAYGAATGITVKFQLWGSTLNLKAWDMTTPEPGAYQITVTDTTYPAAGTIDLGSIRNPGNTNGTINMQFDNFTVADVCESLMDVEACSNPVTIACDGCFRLGDPVRPCNDVRICLCANGVECEGTGGIFFVSMTPDTRNDNSGQIVPINDAYPIPVSRRRMKPTSNLQVVATSFVARDTLINLLDAGGPLLLRSPPEYGIGDRYLQIGNVPETYGLSDMTSQPRILQMPNAEVRGPVGPTQGVCGARVEDLCDVYATWDALVAAGLTYADLLRGDASSIPSGLATWDSINAGNADWAALQAAETDWADVLDGD